MSLPSRRTRILATVFAAPTLLIAAACGSGVADQSADASAPAAGDDAVAAPAVAAPAAAGDLEATGGARRTAGDRSAAIRDAVDTAGAKNVILLIGDGMGDSEITSARNVAVGAGGAFAGLDALPMTGQYTHYSLNRETGLPDYVTDSAASGTAWATGTKSYNGAISVDIDGAPVPTLLELAKDAGLKTGNVSTAEIQDATPAVQQAHVTERKCYGPEATSEKCPDNALENGGDGSISEQYLDSRADVVLGGGAASFEERAEAGDYEGETLFAQAEARGYQVVRTPAELDAVDSADQDAPLLGLFADGNFAPRWTGDKAVVGGIAEPAQQCTDNPERDTAAEPTLAAMTDKAIDLLSGTDEGFFLQVEGASIDKENHAANPCGQIGETVDLDEAVQVALEFAEQEGDTLVIVTADHAHTSQIVALDTESPALTSRLVTADGAEMGILYGTAEEDESQGHTGAQLRIAAYGPRAANVVGLTDQTDVFFTIADALGLEH